MKACIVGRTRRKESARYMKHMQSKVALQKIKYDIEKLLLQAMFNTMGVVQTEQTLQIMQKHKRPTSQRSSESSLEEGEAPFPARSARVSRVLFSWLIFEPAQREQMY